MPERAPLAVAAICAAALGAIVLTAAADDRRVAFAFGVPPAGIVVTLARGDEACQRPIDVPASADGVRFTAAVREGMGAPLRVRVQREEGAASATVLALGGRQAAVEAPVGVREGERVAICVRSEARGAVGLYGGPVQAAGESALYAAGQPVPADLSLEFVHAEPRSALSLAPAVLERAALFNASWVAPWLLWGLAAAFAIAVPALLTGALRGALRDPGPPGPGEDGP